MTSAGSLRDRIAFDSRIETDDGAGNVRGKYSEQFVRWAEIKARFGGEEITAARLAGRQPVTILVRYDAMSTSRITPAWRARDVRKGTVYNIRAVADPDGRRQWLELLAESGAAAV